MTHDEGALSSTHWDRHLQGHGQGKVRLIQWLRQEAESQDVRKLLEEIKLEDMPEHILKLIVLYGPAEPKLWEGLIWAKNLELSLRESSMSRGQRQQLGRLGQNRQMTEQAACWLYDQAVQLFCEPESKAQRQMGKALLDGLLEEGWAMPGHVREQLVEQVASVNARDWNQHPRRTRTAYQLLIKTPGLERPQLDRLTRNILDLPPDLMKAVIHHPEAGEKIWARVLESLQPDTEPPEDGRSSKQRALDKITSWDAGPSTHQHWVIEQLLDHPEAAQMPMVARAALQVGGRKLLAQLAQQTNDRDILGQAIERMLEDESARWVVRWLQNACSNDLLQQVPRHSFQPLLGHPQENIRQAALRLLGRQAGPPQTSQSSKAT